MKEKWKELSALDKVMVVISIILTIIAIGLVYLQVSGAMEDALQYVVPLLGVYLLVSAVQEWKKRRVLAIISICIAILIFILQFGV